jgi:hypothetical protein
MLLNKSLFILLDYRKHLFYKLVAAVMTWTRADSCNFRPTNYGLDDAIA